MPPNIKEIAKVAGVSVSTVSKSLTDKEDISHHTKKRIKKIAKEMGYRPNFAARSLVTGQSMTLGVVTPYLIQPTIVERIRGIQNAAIDNGYIAIISFAERNSEEERKQIKTLLSRRVDGLILTPFKKDKIIIKRLQEDKVPFVFMSESIRGVRADFVGDDDKKGATLATEHLVKIGHTKIAYLGSSPETYSDTEMLKGYKEVLKKYKIRFYPEFITWGNNIKESVERNIIRVMRLKEHPTAIFAWSDMTAIWALEKLEELGFRIPSDVALIGYDNIEFSRFFHIPLTTISQPNYEIGYRSATLLLERIKEPDAPKRKVVYKPKLIVRKSCGLNLTKI